MTDLGEGTRRQLIQEEQLETLSDEDDFVETVAEIPGVEFPDLSTREILQDDEIGFGRPLVTSTPGFKMSSPEERTQSAEEQLQKTQQELEDLKILFDRHRKQLWELEQKQEDLSKIQGEITRREDQKGCSKIPLPAKYDGEFDFNDYLAQFDALSNEHGWNHAQKGVMLLGRLKGRALEVAAKGKDLTFGALVERLREHFAPEHEEMFAQRLQAVQKKPGQTWEDLAYVVHDLASKGYKGVPESTQQRLAVHAFINAIPEDHIREKTRDSHPLTMKDALQRVRQVEADMILEKQRLKQIEDKPERKEAVKVVQTSEAEEKIKKLEEQLRSLQTRFNEEKSKKDKRTNEPREAGRVPRPGSRRGGFNWHRGRGRGRGFRGCFTCGGPHLQRECPWRHNPVTRTGPRAEDGSNWEMRSAVPVPASRQNVPALPYQPLN